MHSDSKCAVILSYMSDKIISALVTEIKNIIIIIMIIIIMMMMIIIIIIIIKIIIIMYISLAPYHIQCSKCLSLK